MLPLPRSLTLSACVLAGLLLVTAPHPQQSHALWSPLVPWGITLQSDRIYYEVGDTLEARAVIANTCGQSAWGWSNLRGGHGCTYDFTIRDVAFDQTVWVPGTIAGGQFFGPGCFFAATDTLYAPGSTRRIEQSIPLVYQNPAGIGTLGASLPPGAYELRVSVDFYGPNHDDDPVGPGGNFSAVVPFRIE